MKSLTEYLTFKTNTRRAFVNITPDIEKLVIKSGVKVEPSLVNPLHITASPIINYNVSGLRNDYEKWLQE